jgi:hypothetical protein
MSIAPLKTVTAKPLQETFVTLSTVKIKFSLFIADDGGLFVDDDEILVVGRIEFEGLPQEG